jgi:hypothetical protein
MADFKATKGMFDAGYEYISMDDGWQIDLIEMKPVFGELNISIL